MGEHEHDLRTDELPAHSQGFNEPKVDLADSMMSALREQYETLAKSNTVDLPIPGYNGMLWARYHLLDVQNDMKKIGRRIRKQFKEVEDQIFYVNLDAMILACEGLYYDRDGEKLSLAEGLADGNDEPVKYDQRLATFLGWPLEEVASARDVVKRLFKNESAIIEHGRQLNDWMRDTTKDVNDDFLGGLT